MKVLFPITTASFMFLSSDCLLGGKVFAGDFLQGTQFPHALRGRMARAGTKSFGRRMSPSCPTNPNSQSPVYWIPTPWRSKMSAAAVVFPYRGVYLRHVGSDQAVADANHVLFFSAGEGYQVSHPLAGGDANLSLTLSEPVLRELAQKLREASSSKQS
jgi:hypothetical protein